MPARQNKAKYKKTADTVEIGVEETDYPEILELIRKHEYLWDGTMGEINIT